MNLGMVLAAEVLKRQLLEEMGFQRDLRALWESAHQSVTLWPYFLRGLYWSIKKAKTTTYCTWATHKETISVWRRHTTAKRSLFTSRKQKTPDSWQLNQHSECLPELHPYGPVMYLLLPATMTLLIWNSKVLISWKTCIWTLNAKHSQQPNFSWG